MDITYRFVASGHQDVEKAFTGIEQRARASKKATDEAMRSGRGGGAGAGAAAGGGGARRGLSETERLAQRVAASQERQARQEVRVAERAAIAKQRAEVRAKQHVARIRDKHFADAQRQEERGEKDRVRRAERSAKEAARLEAAAKKKAQSESDSSRDKSIGVLKDLAGGAFLATVGTGAALIGSAAKEALSLQEASNRISINSRKSGEGFRSASELRRGFERTAIATPGQTASGIADAVARFVALTGDVDTALKSQGTFATVASATGADVGDVAEAAASLSQQFDITGFEEMKEVLASLTMQGKEGAVELRDLAAQLQGLSAAGAAFGLPKGAGGVKILGGLTQIARGSTKSADQAAFAVSALFRQFGSKQKELAASGVKVFEGGKIRDIRDLIIDSISKVGGKDIAKKQAGLQEIFGDEGLKGIKSLVSLYNDTYRDTKGTDKQKLSAATDALRAEFAKNIDAAGNWADVQEDAAQAQTDASAKIAAAWESIKAKTADSLLPTIEALATKLTETPEVMDPFIESVGLAGDALEGIVDIAKKFGLVKEPTKAEKLERAKTALARFDAKHNGIGPLTAEDQAKRNALADAVTSADDALWGKNQKGTPDGLDYLAAKPQSQDFGDALIAYARGTTGTALQAAGGMGLVENDWMMKYLGGETDAQADIRHQRSAKEKATEANAGVSVSTDDVQRALDAAAKAAEAAAGAMQKMAAANQGSIVGP